MKSISTISISELTEIARRAGEKATDDSRKKGLPITEIKNGRVIKTHASKTKEMVV